MTVPSGVECSHVPPGQTLAAHQHGPEQARIDAVLLVAEHASSDPQSATAIVADAADEFAGADTVSGIALVICTAVGAESLHVEHCVSLRRSSGAGTCDPDSRITTGVSRCHSALDVADD